MRSRQLSFLKKNSNPTKRAPRLAIGAKGVRFQKIYRNRNTLPTVKKKEDGNEEELVFPCCRHTIFRYAGPVGGASFLRFHPADLLARCRNVYLFVCRGDRGTLDPHPSARPANGGSDVGH